VGGGVLTLAAAPATPLRESLARLERLVSPWTGAVGEVHEVLAAPEDARLPRYAVALPDTAPLLGFRADHLGESSGGCAESRERARAAAIGEAVERYAASFVPQAGLVRGSARELGRDAVAPERFSLFAPEQHADPAFPFVPFTRDTVVRWARGFSLPAGAPHLLPAQLVYLEWQGFRRGEPPIGYATSSGLACGATLEESVLAGLLELVERDAFMLTWTHRLSLPLLDWRDEPELVRWERRYLDPAGGEHAVVDLSCFLDVPVALAVVSGDGVRQPVCAVGAGSAPTAAQAWKKALAEAYSVRSWGRALVRAGGRVPQPAEIATFADHVRYHAAERNRAAASFLTVSSDRRPVADVSPIPGRTPLERISALCARLAGHGCRASAVDVTTPDARQAGVAVARVVAPELCPLDVRHDARFLGGERLLTLPFRLGLTAAPAAWDDVNHDPHPFP
jgi:ribosomal protein S12 methylthiotransferase accessory factor